MRATHSASSSSGPRHGSSRAATAQYAADALLFGSFDSGGPFDYYSQSLLPPSTEATDAQVAAYLSKLQRGGLVQLFGCLLAVHPVSFSLLAYSANAPALLGLALNTPSLLSIDAREFFTRPSASALTSAAAARDLAMANPIWVRSQSSHKPFYAILHRVDVGLVIDLEPAPRSEAASHHSALPAHRLAARGIARLQSLPGGDVGALCDAVVEHVQELTGYDRVMVYRFHDDEHGEVVAEIRRSDLEPYLGLHHPATDIPQAARFLFKQNRMRIIVDCAAEPVPIVQDRRLERPLSLVRSTLRAPHRCHRQYMTNMGAAASLVMAVVVSDGGGSTNLWGLVVCHHTSPRYVPFPARHACEFVMQAFGLQLNLELQLASQVAEKKILKSQILFCDLLLRDAPLGIVNQSPNIMDLVKCDGAALYYDGKCYRLGMTPTDEQIKDIVEWLRNCHSDSTGFSTESLAEAGYPGVIDLSGDICGMAAARIISKDFLLWFRCQTAKEIKWGGAKHQPGIGDDGGKMNPRLSFKVFLEVVKNRSLPWEALEINAIHSLQLILRESLQDVRDRGDKMMARAGDVETERMYELNVVACEMVRLIETARAPIIAVDAAGLINGWNARAAELTGLLVEEAMGKSLVHEIAHEDSCELIARHLSRALEGFEDKNIELKLRTFGLQQKNSTIVFIANACASKDSSNSIVGICFVSQDVTGEKAIMDKFIRLQEDYKTIIQSVNPLIPPIFSSDENIRCSEWNSAMEALTGWTREVVIGKFLPGEIFGGLCQLKGDDALTKFMALLYGAMGGKDIEQTPFAFLDKNGNHVETVFTANQRTDMDGNVIGCFCFLQPATSDLQQALYVQKQQERKWLARLKDLAYIRHEIKNPLNGMRYTHKLLESTSSSDEQKQFLETSTACERQLVKIIEDMGLESIEHGRMELDIAWFDLGKVLDAVFSQVMLIISKKNLELIQKIPKEIKTMNLYGDQSRLQQVLADFLLYIVNHAPIQNSWVEFEVSPSIKQEDLNEFVHLQFRITHPGQGIPLELAEDILYGNLSPKEEVVRLNISRRLLKLMNGSVQYVREPMKSYFFIDIEVQTTKSGARS